MASIPPMERFQAKVAFNPETGCDEWQGYRRQRREQYGEFSVGGVLYQAHRWLYEQTYGPVDRSLVVRHSCDNPPCVTLAHLLVGTQADNVRDTSVRGRARNGTTGRLGEPQHAEA